MSKTKSMDDYIRETRSYALQFEASGFKKNAEFMYDLADYLKSLPTPAVADTNVGGKWIPCSERLPKSEDKYGWVECIVTVMRSHWPTSSYDSCDSPYDEYFVTGAMYDTSQKIWHLGEHTQLNALIDIEDSPLNGDYVIAWQPLPHAFKGE